MSIQAGPALQPGGCRFPVAPCFPAPGSGRPWAKLRATHLSSLARTSSPGSAPALAQSLCTARIPKLVHAGVEMIGSLRLNLSSKQGSTCQAAAVNLKALRKGAPLRNAPTHQAPTFTCCAITFTVYLPHRPTCGGATFCSAKRHLIGWDDPSLMDFQDLGSF